MYRLLTSVPRMTDHVEPLVVRGRSKVRRDGLELRLGSERRSLRKRAAALAQLSLAALVGRVDEVHLVRHARGLEQPAEPRSLSPGVRREVEHDRNTARQKRADVPGQGLSQAGRVLDERRKVDDLLREQSVEQLVLNEEDGVLAP